MRCHRHSDGLAVSVTRHSKGTASAGVRTCFIDPRTLRSGLAGRRGLACLRLEVPDTKVGGGKLRTVVLERQVAGMQRSLGSAVLAEAEVASGGAGELLRMCVHDGSNVSSIHEYIQYMW